MLTAERLMELVAYDPSTGVFRWKITDKRMKAGEIAGGDDGNGYCRIKIDGKRHRAHRLAFLYMTGTWPSLHIDHKNGNPGNNAWANLRAATRQQNKANSRPSNRLGVKGVYEIAPGKFKAEIRANGKHVYLGVTNNRTLAGYLYKLAAAFYFGEFARVT